MVIKYFKFLFPLFCGLYKKRLTPTIATYGINNKLKSKVDFSVYSILKKSAIHSLNIFKLHFFRGSTLY